MKKNLYIKFQYVLFFYLHRRAEPLQIHVQNVFLYRIHNVDVEYPNYSKHHLEGLLYKILGYLKPTFRKYLSQLPESNKPDSRFFKNFNEKSKTRAQNYGINNISKLSKYLASWLEKGNFTTHPFCRSTAIALAELGIKITALCNAGK